MERNVHYSSVQNFLTFLFGVKFRSLAPRLCMEKINCKMEITKCDSFIAMPALSNSKLSVENINGKSHTKFRS